MNYPDFKPGLQEPWFLPEYPQNPIYSFIPESYHPDRPFGLFFFMHGGDKSTPPEAPLWLMNEKNGDFRPHIAKIPFITVGPAALSAIDGKRWNRAGVSTYIEAVIASAKERFNIDPDRIIAGGHSMGGFGAYHQGALLNDRFAALWLSSGAWLEEDFRAFLGTPTYIMHGTYDCAATYCTSQVLLSDFFAHRSCEHESVAGQRFTEPRHHDWCGVSFGRAAHELMLRDDVPHVYDEFPAGHSLQWEPAQQAFRRFFTWAARQKRNPYPNRCAVITPNGSCDPDLEPCMKKFYLEILETTPGNIELDKIFLTGPNIAWNLEDFEAQGFYLGKKSYPGARLEIENLGNNHFSVQTENIASFRCYLAPQMADLNSEIDFNINGKSYRTNAVPCNTKPDYTAFADISL